MKNVYVPLWNRSSEVMFSSQYKLEEPIISCDGVRVQPRALHRVDPIPVIENVI